MTTERWDDDRLDRLADQTEANTQSISQLISVIEEQQKANTTLFEMLIQEIRGLRTENKRILNHLFGEESE